MQHFGDLRPLGQTDMFSGEMFGPRPAQGRYNASRSRWKLAVGGVEIGFQREREEVSAESRSSHSRITPDQLPAPRARERNAERGIGERFMTLLGITTALLLITGATGLIWTMRSGATVGRGEISTAIRDIEPVVDAGAGSGNKAPFTIPARPRKQTLLAVIETARPGPVAPPAAAISSAITEAASPQSNAAQIANASAQAVRSGAFAAVPQVASAISAAMTSGEAQNWSAGAYHGLVVVGEASADTCREGTVLLRDGSEQGRTQTFKRCAR